VTGGRRVEVGAARDGLDLAAREIDRHELIDPLPVGRHHVGLVVLADGIEPTPRGIMLQVREPPGPLGGKRREDARGGDPVEPPGAEIGHDHELAGHQGRCAAVLMDAGSGVEALGREASDGPVRVAPDQDLAACFLGPALEPPANAAGPTDLEDTVGMAGAAGSFGLIGGLNSSPSLGGGFWPPYGPLGSSTTWPPPWTGRIVVLLPDSNAAA
jgi:hypothetical protein